MNSEMITPTIILATISCALFLAFHFHKKAILKKVENDALNNSLQIELDAQKKSSAIDIDTELNRITLGEWVSKKDPS